MPLLNESSVGATSVTSPTLSLVDNSFTYTSAKNTDMLFVDQLPKLVFYIVQTVGANPITVTPQFALRSTTGVSEPQLIWFQLSAPFVMPALNTPVLLNFEMPCQFIRFSITSANATQTVQFVLAAHAS